jgi:hypothetical protein
MRDVAIIEESSRNSIPELEKFDCDANLEALENGWTRRKPKEKKNDE